MTPPRRGALLLCALSLCALSLSGCTLHVGAPPPLSADQRISLALRAARGCDLTAAHHLLSSCALRHAGSLPGLRASLLRFTLPPTPPAPSAAPSTPRLTPCSASPL